MKKEDSRCLYDGFEGNSLSEIWDQRKLEEGSVKFQSKIVRKGKKAIKVTIHKGDRIEKGTKGSKTSERDEIEEMKYLGPKEGKSYSYSFSMFIPKTFPIVPVRLVLAQWRQTEDENASVDNPVLALRYVNGELHISLQTTKKKERLFSTKKEMRNKWIDFKFEIKLTRSKSGFVRAFINKKKVVDYKGITAYSEKYGYPKPGSFYFKMGLYRDRMEKPMIIYIDEFKKERLK